MSIAKEIKDVADRLNINLEEKEKKKAEYYLIKLRDLKLSVARESLSTHSLELALNDFGRGFPLKEAVDFVAASLQEYVSHQRYIAGALHRPIEFSFSTIAVFLGCTQLTSYCERVLDAYKEWYRESQSKIAYNSKDWDLFNFRLGIFIAVCDAVSFKVPQEYRSQLVLNNNITKNTRKQVSEALKDLLLEISVENKLKSSKKRSKGSTPSMARGVPKSQKATPKNSSLKAGTGKENERSEVTPLSKQGLLTAVPPVVDLLSTGLKALASTSVPASAQKWKISPAKVTKRIATGRNMMAPVESLAGSEKYKKACAWISKIIEKIDNGQIRAMDGAVDDFGQKYHCDSCNKDITHLLIIRCAICSDFDLCIRCFKDGIELKDHKKTHDYRVIDVLDFPIFEADWGADEELLLVEGLELFGLGNWETISEHIGTKNSHQVADHYNLVYVRSDAWPYPNMEDRFDMAPGKRKRARPNGYVVPELPKPPRAPASQPVNHEIGGFMPGRKEFEYEFENDADQIIKDIEFMPEDSKEDTALKCAVLNNYNLVLDRRLARKAFLFERGFTEFKKIQAIEKKRSKEEKELYHKYRVFAKMQTVQDFDEFMEGVVIENRLRNRIAQLQEYVRMGITSVKEANDYEKQKVARANKTITLPQVDRAQIKRSHSLREDTPPLGSPNRTSLSLGGQTANPNAPTTRNTVVPLDISNAEGVDLLGESEKAICAVLRIFPRAYLSVKDIILKEFALKGVIHRKIMRACIKVDQVKTAKIIEYFAQQGWIQTA